MVTTIFHLRFAAQLRRTRHELIQQIEDSITQAAQDAGGVVSRGRQCIKAVYDEHSVGFWLDILMLIETLLDILSDEKSELYGYALLIGKDLTNRPESLCRTLAISPQDGGVFLDRTARDALNPYFTYEPVQMWPSSKRGRSQESFVRIKKLKNTVPEQNFQLSENILSALKQDQKSNALIMGSDYSEKHEGIYRFCRDSMADFPPLSVRFGTGGLNALTDSWSEALRELAQAAAPEIQNTAAEIEGIWKYLFQQRLREEISPFMFHNGQIFFSLLVNLYIRIAKQRGVTPTFILEDIHLAEKAAVRILKDTIHALPSQHDILLMGTCSKDISDANVKKWEELFPRIIKITSENSPQPFSQISPEIREIAYLLYLFNRCFPASMFLQLLHEEGKNPAMLIRALSIMYNQGIIDSIDDPRLCIKNFISKAEIIPEGKRKLVRAMVHRRLLYWVNNGKINPCFNLLTILTDLNKGAYPSDELVLKSIYADMVSRTVQEINNAIDNGLLQNTVGEERTSAIIYLYNTMQALLTGTENEIRSAFVDTAPDCSAFPVLKAQILVNQSAWQLGMRNMKPALETIKETILLGQGKNNFCLAQSYRLFSLVNLSRHQVGETNEYLNFAMENAEKSGNNHELGISAYYAAASQFLFGNISKAMRLARKALEHTLTAGLPDWADKARFLQGRLTFEIGAYNEALDIFETLLKKPSGKSSPGKDRLLAAWAYRARVFLRSPLLRKPSDNGCDADLFEIEAAYLAKDYRKTVELANALIPSLINENFIFTEQPDWRSGFAQCELLFFSQEEIWKRMVCTYHSLALCRISCEAGEEAKTNMQRVLRDEQLSEMDPWDAFYFYAWYSILEHSGAEQIDKNTAISLAFKRLQRRASRIDDIETRRQFLAKPRWNGELSKTAREFRLI